MLNSRIISLMHHAFPASAILIADLVRNYAIIVCGLTILASSLLCMRPRRSRQGTAKISGRETHLQPRFFFCSASHARFSPVPHKFTYPVMYAGFPADLHGPVGGLFSVLPGARALFTVDPAKYFSPELSFRDKITELLTSRVSAAPLLRPHRRLTQTRAWILQPIRPHMS